METDGIAQVGEVPVVLRRMSEHEADHTEARKSARIEALREVGDFVQMRLDAAGPYDDVRPWVEMRIWIADRIRDAAA
jgi:hypothetical protein